MKYSKFWKLGFLWQTLDHPTLEPGQTPKIDKIYSSTIFIWASHFKVIYHISLMISLVKFTTFKHKIIWSLWRKWIGHLYEYRGFSSRGRWGYKPYTRRTWSRPRKSWLIQSWINLYYKCLPKDTKDVLIPWPRYLKGRTEIRIWPWETSWRMWRSRMQRPCSHKSLSNQEQLEAMKNAEVVMATLNGLPGS